MKYLLIPLALFAGQTMACPDASKDAMAPMGDKSLSAAKATAPSALATSLAAAPAAKAAKSSPKASTARTDTKLAAKSDARKAAPL